jgi:hypothetical protein
MKTAKEIYESQEESILNLVKAADIFALNLLAKFRNNSPPPNDTIQSILDGAVSVLNFTAFAFNEPERKLLARDGHLRSIGQQIIVTSFTAIELYLTNKFYEYYRNSISGLPNRFIEASMKQLYIRSIKDVSKLFYDFFGIHLPSFDFDFYTGEGCIFTPATAWDALMLLSTARNEIAHKGESSSYKITTLVDSWHPFDFTRYFVEHFEYNFDDFIYRQKVSTLVLEHNTRLEKSKKKT